jgi:hypothetical protein
MIIRDSVGDVVATLDFALAGKPASFYPADLREAWSRWREASAIAS